MEVNVSTYDYIFDNLSWDNVNNDYSYIDYPDIAMSKDWQITLTITFSITMALSIGGNSLVIIVLMCGRSAKNDLNRFLINLAISDITLAVFSMPFSFTTLMYGHWMFGRAMCPIVLFVQQVSVSVSIYTLTAIGIDRYFAVIYPLKIRPTNIRNRVALLLVWVVSLLLSVVQLVVGYTKELYWDGSVVVHCAEWWPNERISAAYELFVMCITYFVPLILLSYTYISVGRRLWGRKIPGNADLGRDRSHAKSKRKVIKMLVVVLLTFALCWLPLHVFNIVQRIHPVILQHDMTRAVNAVVLWLAMSNSFVNPFIYSFMNDNFRGRYLNVDNFDMDEYNEDKELERIMNEIDNQELPAENSAPNIKRHDDRLRIKMYSKHDHLEGQKLNTGLS
ncbi:substance-P receptor-like [Saccoglossus kowalevskii]